MTGKKSSARPVLKPGEVQAVIVAGRDFYPLNDKNGYKTRSNEALLAGLTSWSPTVRQSSEKELGLRKSDFIPALQKMLASKEIFARYGARIHKVSATGSSWRVWEERSLEWWGNLAGGWR